MHILKSLELVYLVVLSDRYVRDKPDNDSNIADCIVSIADKVGAISDQLLILAGGSLAALVLLIIVMATIERKRR